MSSPPSRRTRTFDVLIAYEWGAVALQRPDVMALLEPFRGHVETLLDGFVDGEQSWRDGAIPSPVQVAVREALQRPAPASPTASETLDLSTLDPGIRRTVAWLRGLGFETTDSGDGRTKFIDSCGPECPQRGPGHVHLKDPAETEGVLDVPHVHMVVRNAPGFCNEDKLAPEAHRLQRALRESLCIEPEPGTIQATYDPVDGSCVISLYGIDDSMLPSGLGEETST